MDEAAKEITTTEEIILSPEGSVDEVKEEIKRVPSGLHQALHQLAAAWGGLSDRPSASRSDVVVGASLVGMYGAKWQALDKEHEHGRPHKR
jgi:hypothetical protein